MGKKVILFGFYEEDLGFAFPGFFSNEKELIENGKLIPLYTVEELEAISPQEGGQ